jgi:hypothetical protein
MGGSVKEYLMRLLGSPFHSSGRIILFREAEERELLERIITL